jgi:hypothetical protein
MVSLNISKNQKREFKEILIVGDIIKYEELIEE